MNISLLILRSTVVVLFC